MEKKIVYIDMDDCLADYTTAFNLSKQTHPHVLYPQSLPGFFRALKPLSDAVQTIKWMAATNYLDIFILSAPSIKNPLCYTEKRIWIEEYLGFHYVDRLILSTHKHLNKGDYLIDDNLSGKGQEKFEGELIHFGSDVFPDWRTIKIFFERNIKNIKDIG